MIANVRPVESTVSDQPYFPRHVADRAVDAHSAAAIVYLVCAGSHAGDGRPWIRPHKSVAKARMAVGAVLTLGERLKRVTLVKAADR